MSQKNIHLLTLILDHKNILFGAFSATLTQEDKNRAWEEILNEFKRLYGSDPSNGKGWKYLRNTVWPNLRNYTVVSSCTGMACLSLQRTVCL